MVASELTPRTALPAARGGASELTRARIRSAWLFLSPTLVVLALVVGWPLFRTIWFGFTDANLSDLAGYEWIGFDNYFANYDGEYFGPFADGDWWAAVWNTVWFSAVSVSLETVLGMIVALVLNADFKGRGFVRAAVLIPWAIPTIVFAKMWAWMLHDQFGVLNDMLMTVGIISSPIAWTANPDTAMWAVIMVDVWKTTPFMALLILAGLQMLPSDFYEAARVDGISPVRVFWRVTLPLVWPAVMVAVIFRALDPLRIFDLVYVLTSNSKETMSMSVFARQQLVDFQEVGYGSAASTLLFLIIATLVIVTITVGRVKLGGGFSLMAALRSTAFYALVAVIVLFSVFPFYYAILSSLEGGSELFRVNYLPIAFDLSNYVAVFREQPFGRNILNSVVVAVAVVIVSLFLGVTASYALGRIRFRGRGLLLLTILAVSMFPQVAVLSGMFELIRALGIYNSLPGLILSNLILTLPFTVWVLTTFMRELPKELEEAAFVDGASPAIVVRRVFLPLLGPAMVTTGLLAFIAAWNEFLFALTFTLSNEMRTVPVAIALITGASQHELPWGNVMAASVIVTVPLIVLVLIFQRKIVAGLTAGAVKG